MTLSEVITFVDGIEPNAYTNEQKARWVRECEGLVWTRGFLLEPRPGSLHAGWISCLRRGWKGWGVPHQAPGEEARASWGTGSGVSGPGIPPEFRPLPLSPCGPSTAEEPP